MVMSKVTSVSGHKVARGGGRGVKGGGGLTTPHAHQGVN